MLIGRVARARAKAGHAATVTGATGSAGLRREFGRGSSPPAGPRRWLAELNPEWPYLTTEVAESTADPGLARRHEGPASRIPHRARRADPAAARDLLAADWPTLPPDERGELLAILATGLGPDDESSWSMPSTTAQRGTRRGVDLSPGSPARPSTRGWPTGPPRASGSRWPDHGAANRVRQRHASRRVPPEDTLRQGRARLLAGADLARHPALDLTSIAPTDFSHCPLRWAGIPPFFAASLRLPPLNATRRGLLPSSMC